jgi:hypothetical protein
MGQETRTAGDILKMEIPKPLNTIASLIDSHHASKNQDRRLHFGISMIGQPCERRQWLTFRWAFVEQFEGRILRLFRRGQNEELQVVEDLRAIGIDVREVGSNQRRVKISGHVSGSIDGIIYGGVPEAPKSQHILEIKTHNKKSFDLLEKDGVQKSKPEHYAQMQGYMLGTGIDRALYFAVCKDDDRIYTERVKLDREFAKKITDKAIETSQANNAPPPISTDPGWYQCKMCPAWELCHGNKKTDQVNCRTCAHSTAKDDGSWHCERWAADIPGDAQKQGCDSHVLHPDLVPWPMVQDKNTQHTAAYEINGKVYQNGEGCIKSKEMIAHGFGDPGVMQIREIFGGELQ